MSVRNRPTDKLIDVKLRSFDIRGLPLRHMFICDKLIYIDLTPHSYDKSFSELSSHSFEGRVSDLAPPLLHIDDIVDIPFSYINLFNVNLYLSSNFTCRT